MTSLLFCCPYRETHIVTNSGIPMSAYPADLISKNGVIFLLKTQSLLGEERIMLTTCSWARSYPYLYFSSIYLTTVWFQGTGPLSSEVPPGPCLLGLPRWHCVCVSRVPLCATPQTVALQTPLSMGFSRQECWSGLPFPSPGDLLNPGIKPESPFLQVALPSEPPGKPKRTHLPVQEM